MPGRHGEKKRPMVEGGHERHSGLTCQAESEWVVTQASELLCRTENEVPSIYGLWTRMHCGTVAASADVLADERLQVPSMGLGFGTVPCGK